MKKVLPTKEVTYEIRDVSGLTMEEMTELVSEISEKMDTLTTLPESQITQETETEIVVGMIEMIECQKHSIGLTANE